MSTRTPLILDVDTGIDDSLALLYAAASDDAELVAATCVSGNIEARQVAINTRAARTSRSRSGARSRWFDRWRRRPRPTARRDWVMPSSRHPRGPYRNDTRSTSSSTKLAAGPARSCWSRLGR